VSTLARVVTEAGSTIARGDLTRPIADRAGVAR
jgi:hypothetical protein